MGISEKHHSIISIQGSTIHPCRPNHLRCTGKSGAFHSHGGSQNGWFMIENFIKMDENWGYPHFRKSPNGDLDIRKKPVLIQKKSSNAHSALLRIRLWG